MTIKWRNPVKNKPPKESTLQIEGDWDKFTNQMRKIVQVKPKGTREGSIESPSPAASSEHRSES